MKIVATSDLHGVLPDPVSYPESDVFIIAGDVCPVIDHSDSFQRSWLQTNFAHWLRQLPTDLVLGIAGNHDFALERYPLFAQQLPWRYLLDEGIEVDGVRFWGSPWVPNLSRWAFHALDHDLDDKLAMIPGNTNVVISHGPPQGYCDFTMPQFGSVHAGFPGTLEMFKRVKPPLFICGHIHEGYGSDHANGTAVLNVSHMTENYKPINRHAVIDYVWGRHGEAVIHDLAKTRTPDEQEFWKAAY